MKLEEQDVVNLEGQNFKKSKLSKSKIPSTNNLTGLSVSVLGKGSSNNLLSVTSSK